MKTKAICSFFVLFAIVAGLVATTPAAFADHSEVTISTATENLSVPGCEVDDECYIPSTATVDFGGKVIMVNADSTSGVHTFTSYTTGDVNPAPSGVFDSGMLMGTLLTFEWTADTLGDIPYYCTLHPWMKGMITVQEAEAEEETHDETEEETHDETEEETHDETEEDLMVLVSDSAVLGGTQVDLEFGELHVNYEITATQNGETVYEETRHAMEMTDSIQVDAVGSDDNPIDIEIVSLGIGAPGAEEDWTGPVGTVATAKVVPEFGTVAMMILVVSIISIIAVTTKSRVIPRF